MNLTIIINKEDIGVNHRKVKSLLQKLQTIEKIGSSTYKLELKIDTKEDHINELSTAIIWRYALLHKNIQGEKTITFPETLNRFFRAIHFFDRLSDKPSKKLSSFAPINLESFSPTRPTSIMGNEDNMEKILSATMKGFLDDKNEFHRELKIQLQEILNNAFDHSELKNEAATICTQKKNGLSFCVADMGQGMKKSFLSNPFLKEQYLKKKDEEVIVNALEFRVSCNPTPSRNPNYPYPNGGIGLFYLKEFVRLHRGSYLVIISNKGYYYFDGTGKEKIKNLGNVEWPGTIVYLHTELDQVKNQRYKDLINDLVEKSNIDNDIINIV